MTKEALIAIVSAAQNGDGDALNTLFQVYYNDVYYFALKNVKDSDLACDITQETFLEIFNTIGQLQEPAAFVSWMKKITYHQCTRYFKKKKDVLVDETEDGATVFDTLEETNEAFIPAEALDQDDFRKTILSMIDELSEEQRAAVMMYYFDELSVKQIADMQGVSEGTVKSRLNYARKAIKASVEDYEKKHGIKLHALPFFPFMGWLFAGEKALIALPQAAAQAMGASLSTASAAATASAASTATAGTLTAQGGATVATGVSSAADAVAGEVANIASSVSSSASTSSAAATNASVSALTTEGTATAAQGISSAANAVAGEVANIASAGGATATASTAAGTTAGAGATVAAVAAKAAIPLAAKIAAGVAAIAVAAAGTVGVVMMTNNTTKKSSADDEEEAAVTTTVDENETAVTTTVNDPTSDDHNTSNTPSTEDGVLDILAQCGEDDVRSTGDRLTAFKKNDNGGYTIIGLDTGSERPVVDYGGLRFSPDLTNIDTTKWKYLHIGLISDVPFRICLEDQRPQNNGDTLQIDFAREFFHAFYPVDGKPFNAPPENGFFPAGNYQSCFSLSDYYQFYQIANDERQYDPTIAAITNISIELQEPGQLKLSYLVLSENDTYPSSTPVPMPPAEIEPEEQTADNQLYTSDALQPFWNHYALKDESIVAHDDYLRYVVTADGRLFDCYSDISQPVAQFDDPSSVRFITGTQEYVYRNADGDLVDQHGNVLNGLGDVIFYQSVNADGQYRYLSADTSTGQVIAFNGSEVVPVALETLSADYDKADRIVPSADGTTVYFVIGDQQYYFVNWIHLDMITVYSIEQPVERMWDGVYHSDDTTLPLTSAVGDDTTLWRENLVGDALPLTLPDGYTTADIKQAFHRSTNTAFTDAPVCDVVVMFNDGSVYYTTSRKDDTWDRSDILSRLGAEGKLVKFHDICYSLYAGELLVLMDDNVWYEITTL